MQRDHATACSCLEAHRGDFFLRLVELFLHLLSLTHHLFHIHRVELLVSFLVLLDYTLSIFRGYSQILTECRSKDLSGLVSL